MSGKTQQKKKNPLKSGNPAVVAAALSGETKPRKKVVVPASGVETKTSSWTPSGNPEPSKPVAPKPRTAQQKKQDRFRRSGQIFIVLMFMGSMILTMFAGLGNTTTNVPVPAETAKVLVDKDGNPIGGGQTPAGEAPVGGTEIPSTIAPADGSSNVIEIPATK